jgi:hypothetical protein
MTSFTPIHSQLRIRVIRARLTVLSIKTKDLVFKLFRQHTNSSTIVVVIPLRNPLPSQPED